MSSNYQCDMRNVNPHFTTKQERVPSPLDYQVGGDHYKLPIQPVDYIVKNDIGYREGNAIKYISRHKLKGSGKEDISKAIHYLEMILEDYNV